MRSQGLFHQPAKETGWWQDLMKLRSPMEKFCLYCLVKTYPLRQPYGLLDPIAFMGIRGGYSRAYKDVNVLLSMTAEMCLI